MTKSIIINDIGEITIRKLKQSKSINIRVGDKITVTMPKWLPYLAAEKFITLKHDWIVSSKEKHKSTPALTKMDKKRLLYNAKTMLPNRVEQLADLYGYKYSGLNFKFLKSRWGSCTRQNIITLNTKLTQLEPELIDYVITHELVHTVHKHHQSDFWKQVEVHIPNHKALKRRLKLVA